MSLTPMDRRRAFENQRKLLKVVIVGNDNVGKRSLAMKFLSDGKMINIIGADVTSKIKKIEREEFIIHSWIIRGNDFAIDRSHYVGSLLYIIIFDVTDRDSFFSIAAFVEELKNNHLSTGIIPIMLVGNKIDLRDEVVDAVSYEEGLTYAKELSKMLTLEVPYNETSVKNDEGGKAIEEFICDFDNYKTLFHELRPDERIDRSIEIKDREVPKIKEKQISEPPKIKYVDKSQKPKPISKPIETQVVTPIGLDIHDKMKTFISNTVDALIANSRKQVNKITLYHDFLSSANISSHEAPESEFLEVVETMSLNDSRMRTTLKLIKLQY